MKFSQIDTNTVEHQRLADSKARLADWKNWGPYVSERAWGTVREDYSRDATVWAAFPFRDAHRRAYRWNEDGIGGFCNRLQNVCLTHAFWNERDPVLKERMFGVNGNEGNHGEDVKEYYFYLDGLPSHAYMKMLYKYPQAAYPYDQLVEANRRRSRLEPEVELVDILSEAFLQGRYFDVVIEYAKAAQDDILCKISATNRGPEAAPLHILPHVFFRNTWSWDRSRPRPLVRQLDKAEAGVTGCVALETKQRHLGTRYWYAEESGDFFDVHFTENETNMAAVHGVQESRPFSKDGIVRRVVHGEPHAVNPAREGTKASAHYSRTVAPGDTMVVWTRYSPERVRAPFEYAESLLRRRVAEADEFYDAIQPKYAKADQRSIQRQAYAGLLWSKQFYHYSVDLWIRGDPDGPPVADSRKYGRNSNWRHLYNLDVISMPDKWEYPWYAVWDLAFHMLPVALLDPEWAKRQIVLFLREWYMHPNGQLPAYEWKLSDANPPVHAWSALRVYQISYETTGKRDTAFLKRVFHKLLLNFTWWVNQKDRNGNNVFEGGFLGLDNIGVFDRSNGLPTGALLEQADGSAWMARYCLDMLAMSVELAQQDEAFEDVATKFFEHFVYIAAAVNRAPGNSGLWDERDGYYYDILHLATGEILPMRVRSFVGLLPLLAVFNIDDEVLDRLPRFKRRMDWFLEYRPDLFEHAAVRESADGNWMFSLVNREKLGRILTRVFDEEQFLSPYGLRSLSKEHDANPFALHIEGKNYSVRYEPAESASGIFGGNSNWRGPIWLPINFMMVEALMRYHAFFGDAFRVSYPTGSAQTSTLEEVAKDLAGRLVRLFERSGDTDMRPFYGGVELFQENEHWRDHILFYEYFHGDNGAGIGASHQTGWTALVANLIQFMYAS